MIIMTLWIGNGAVLKSSSRYKLKERVRRRQFQICRKWQKVIQTSRKHCGKRRTCSLRAISPFPTVFSKGLFPRGVTEKLSLCGNGLMIRFSREVRRKVIKYLPARGFINNMLLNIILKLKI